MKGLQIAQPGKGTVFYFKKSGFFSYSQLFLMQKWMSSATLCVAVFSMQFRLWFFTV